MYIFIYIKSSLFIVNLSVLVSISRMSTSGTETSTTAVTKDKSSTASKTFKQRRSFGNWLTQHHSYYPDLTLLFHSGLTLNVFWLAQEVTHILLLFNHGIPLGPFHYII